MDRLWKLLSSVDYYKFLKSVLWVRYFAIFLISHKLILDYLLVRWEASSACQ